MTNTRRDFLQGGALGALALMSGAERAAALGPIPGPAGPAGSPREDEGDYLPVEVPDVPKLPWRRVDGVKEFHLTAEVVQRDFLPGRTFDVWGYNGSMPGPTIEVQQGDRVRIVVENRLPEITSMHWHGLELPVEMDGVPGVTQDPIPPGETFVYEFDLHQNGTFFYHSHMAMQEMMGMLGLFIIHPEEPHEPQVDKDFGLMLQEWSILPNNTVPNSLSMEFNWLTLNGRAGPHTTPLIVELGDRVRIRTVNLGMDHHPIHLHGNTFFVTGTEAGRAPESTWKPENTVLVGVAQSRDFEFEARYPGDWMLHCHLPHHMMNHMVSMVGQMMEQEGMQTAMGMEEGMGMMSGSALSDDNGPAMGRAIGVSREQPTSHLVEQGRHQHGGTPDAAQRAPGFPQDMFMAMDEMVAKPETHGMRPTWSGGVMGMMTVVRVLEPEMYEEVQRLRAEAGAEGASNGGRR